jgi:hypothetical protein
MLPTADQKALLLDHCAHARYVWNLAGSQMVQQQALRDFTQAMAATLT